MKTRHKGNSIKSTPYSKKTSTQKAYSKPSPNFQRKAPPKKENIETTQKNEIKTMFMNWFKASRATEGHIMTKQDVINAILKKLGPKQDKAFTKAMDELKNDNLITIQEDGVTLILTQKGAEAL